ncbi:MAG: hypothetical protein PHF24_05075 [Syntrophomonas sp.]|nr:hypothetical protein [Syntrophomonas sp.]
MKYKIKNLTNRVATDLRNYATEIIAGVTSVFPSAHVSVYPQYFEISNTGPVSDFMLRLMGRSIAYQSPHLNSLKKRYGNSTQLFVSF